MYRTTYRGFSLLELLVVVAIIGVIAVVAYPEYLEHKKRARRVEAKSALSGLAQMQESFYVNNNTYTTTLMGTGSLNIGSCRNKRKKL